VSPAAAARAWRAPEVMLLVYVVALFTVSGDPVWTRLENLVGYLLALVVAGSILADPRWALTWSREFAWVLVFVAWGLLATLAATGTGVEPRFLVAQVSRTWTFLQVALLGFLTLQVLTRAHRFRALELGFHAGVVLTLLLAISTGVSGQVAARFGSGLRQANELGLALGVASALCTVQVFRIASSRAGVEGRGLRLVSVLLVQLTAVLLNVLATGSRQGMLTSGAALLVSLGCLLYLLASRRSRTALWGTLCSVAVVAVLAPRVAESPFVSRLLNLPRFLLGRELAIPERSIVDRWHLMQEGIGLWQVRPLAGWGFDAFQFLSPARTYSHSNPVELLANTGLVGFFIFYGAIGLIALRGVHALRNRSIPAWAAGGAIFLAGILVLNGMAAVTYYNKPHWLLFGYALALLIPEHARSGSIDHGAGRGQGGFLEPPAERSLEATCSDGRSTPVSSGS